MRTLILVLVLAGTANAETVSFGTHHGTGGGSQIATVQIITVKLESGHSDDFAEFAIPNITMDDVGRTWTIDESNAATYGLDWQLAASLWGEPVDGWVRANMTNAGLPARLGQPVRCQPHFCIHDFAMSHIDVTVHQFFTSPIGSVREYSATVFGDGNVVPEPATAGLSVMLLLVLLWRRTDL